MGSGCQLGAHKKPAKLGLDQKTSSGHSLRGVRAGEMTLFFLTSSVGSNDWQKRSICQKGRIADLRCVCEASVQLKKKRTFNIKILCGSSESRL